MHYKIAKEKLRNLWAFPLFTTLSLFSAKYEYTLCIRIKGITIYLFSNITQFPRIERTEVSQAMCNNDKFAKMTETQISICVWSPCVFTWEFKAYWLCLVQGKLHQFLTIWSTKPVHWWKATNTLHLWRLQGSKKRFSQEKRKSSVIFISLPNQ